MNPIVKGYMDKFKEDVIQSKDGISDSELFAHFINYILVKRDFSDSFDFNVMNVEGGGDCGIDGIAIVINQEVLDIDDEADIKNIIGDKKLDIDFVFIQSKTSEHLNTGDLLKFFEGVFGFFNKANPAANANNRLKSLFKIKYAIYRESSKFTSNPRLHLRYVYTGKKDTMKDCEQHIKSYKDRLNGLNLFSNVDIGIIDVNDIQKIYKEITLNIDKTIKLEKVATLSTIDNVQETYIGIITLEEFIKLISDDEGKIIKNLFYDNVRDYQGDTSVNMAIKEALIHDSAYFGLFHNGITFWLPRICV